MVGQPVKSGVNAKLLRCVVVIRYFVARVAFSFFP
jgi:hypothetical protein